MELNGNKMCSIRLAKYAFTLVETLIVVSILGILAAIVVPQFQAHSHLAKEAAAKDNLRILRNAIDLYANRNNEVAPGYSNNNPDGFPISLHFYNQLVFQGRYLSEMPENPLNGKTSIRMITNSQTFPEEATDQSGWLYKPATKTIRVNSPGTDSRGARYYDY